MPGRAVWFVLLASLSSSLSLSLFFVLVFIICFIVINVFSILFHNLLQCIKNFSDVDSLKNSHCVRTRGREDAIYLIYWSINIPNLYRRHNSFTPPLSPLSPIPPPAYTHFSRLSAFGPSLPLPFAIVIRYCMLHPISIIAFSFFCLAQFFFRSACFRCNEGNGRPLLAIAG